MLVDVRSVVAVRCPWCGSIQLSRINPFELSGRGRIMSMCECGEELFTVSRIKPGSYQMKIACIACDSHHNYKLGYKELWKRKVHVINCLRTGMEVCFLGKEGHVVQAVERYERELDELISELGLEDFLEGEDLWAESFSQFMDTVERVNYKKEFGKSKTDSVLKGPEHSK